MLRPSRPDDAVPLLALLEHPALAEWWGTNTIESLEEELIGAWTIEVGARVAGILECHEETEPTYPSVSFDIALDAALHARRLGRRALRLAITHMRSRGHHRFVIDPAADNQAARRCYQAVGFQDVGRLRAAERAPDRTWRDAMMMELVLFPGDPLPGDPATGSHGA